MRATPEIDICRAYLKVRHLTKPPAAGNQLSKAEATAQMGEDPFVKHQLLEPEIISIAPSRMTEGFASLHA